MDPDPVLADRSTSSAFFRAFALSVFGAVGFATIAQAALVLTSGSGGRATTSSPYPWDVALAPDGSVYVADQGNHRIQHFTGGGAYLGHWGSSGTGGRDSPHGPIGDF